MTSEYLGIHSVFHIWEMGFFQLERQKYFLRFQKQMILGKNIKKLIKLIQFKSMTFKLIYFI